MKCRACSKKINNHSLKFNQYPVSLWPCNKKLSAMNINMRVYHCRNCSLNQLQRFKNSTISLFYKNRSKVLNNKSLIEKRVSKIKKSVKKFNNLKILEIGGGRNNLLNYFNSKEKWLCDFDTDKIEKNIKLIRKDFNYFNNKNKYFDLIFFFHTLEHIENPKKFLNNVNKNLKQDGKVIIEVPNTKYYLKKIPYYSFFFQHQSLFTIVSLTNLMNLNNFKLEKILSKKDDDNILAIFSKSKKIKSLISEKNFLLKINNKIQKKIQTLKKYIKNKKINDIAIYGCGGASMTLFYHLINNNINVDTFYDNDKKKFNLVVPNTNKKIVNGFCFKKNNHDLIITTSNKIKNEFKKSKNFKNIISLE